MATTTTTTTTTSSMATSSSYIPRGPTPAELTFYAPPADNSAPFYYVEKPSAGQPQRNYNEEPHSVSLTDIRGDEASFSLDKDAFQTLQNIPSSATYSTFDNDTSVREIYYPEVEALLLSTLPGTHKIVIFDHTIRRQKPDAPRQPVTRAHVDQTRRATAERVRLHVSDAEEAESLLKGRYRIVNVWRPLDIDNQPVQSSPLAFATAQSVDDDKDLVAIQHRYPTRTGETMGVRFKEHQKWFYWSGMNHHERLLLKCADSEADTNSGIGRCVPHTAFWHPRTPQGARVRESIEVRALVFG